MLVTDNTREARKAELIATIGDPAFPCVGAKSALARGTLRVEVGHSLASAWDDVRMHRQLLDWVNAYRKDPQGLRSFAYVFDGPCDLSEEEFERLMWERLQSLSDKDEWLGQPYDRSVRFRMLAEIGARRVGEAILE